MSQDEVKTVGQATVDIEAGPDAVWSILTDLSRIGELSPECYKAEWDGDASGPAVGAGFRGYNELGGNRWDVGCTVVAAEPGREWAFEIPGPEGRNTTWRYQIEATETGSRVTESYDAPIVADEHFRNMKPPRGEQLEVNIAKTLQRLKAVAESA